MPEIDPKIAASPATKWEVAQIAAYTTIALKEVALAILSLESGDLKEAKKKATEIVTRSNEIWRVYSELIGDVKEVGGE